MTTTTTNSHLDEMARTGCFVSVHVRKPALRTQLNWKHLGLPELDKALVTPPSTRPPSREYAVFGTLESRMRTCLRTYSAGSAGGFRFVKFSKLGAFVEEVEQIKKAYEEAIEPFLAQYDQSVANALMVWEDKANDLYDSLSSPGVDRVTFCRRIAGQLRRSWPIAAEIRPKFGCDVQILQFTLPSEDVLTTNTDLIRAARVNAQATLNNFFDEAQNELRTRAVEVVRRMHKALVEGETITERSVNPLKRFVDQFRELSVVADAEFQARLDAIVQAIDNRGGAQGLRDSTQAWGEVQSLLGDVAAEGERLVEEASARRMDLSQRAISL